MSDPTSPTLPSPGGSLVGATLAGRYRLLERLGEGAMGEVYRAEHTMMRKTVAVKVLRGDLVGNTEIVARFQREAQAAAQIEHPNVCAAYDFGRTDDGAFFMVMEYLEGTPLDLVLLDHGPLPWRRALRIARAVLEGLQAAHGHGVVHRDIKPENVMLMPPPPDEPGAGEVVKLLDFGIAQVRIGGSSGSGRLTQAGMVYGTPEYMAPEQAVGDEVDARADLYAVGTLLYHMLCGRPPFQADTIAKLLGMQVHDPPPPMSQVAPEGVKIPRALQAAVMRLLNKNPSDRPSSAQAAIELLERAQSTSASMVSTLVGAVGPLAHVPSSATLVGLRTQVARRWGALPGPTRLRVLGGSALIVVALLSMIVLLIAVGDDPDDAAAAGVVGEASAEAESLEASRQAFTARDAQIRQALDAMTRGDMEAAINELELLRIHHADNPHFHYYLAMAHGRMGAWKAALSAYQQAYTLEPRYGADPKLAEDIEALLADGDDEQRQALAALLAAEAAPPASVIDVFRDIARTHESRTVRQRAQAALEEHGHFDGLDRWEQLSIKLMNDSGCRTLGGYIEELAELGDPRGREAIVYYAGLPTRGCGRLDRKDCFGCIRDEISAALEALPDPAPAAVHGGATR